MRRAAMKRLAEEIAGEVSSRPYSHWRAQRFPVCFSRTFEGRELQVELDLLEQKEEYIHIGIAVDDGKLSAFFPASTSVIIHREKGA
jgi:hypothetical protein